MTEAQKRVIDMLTEEMWTMIHDDALRDELLRKGGRRDHLHVNPDIYGQVRRAILDGLENLHRKAGK